MAHLVTFTILIFLGFLISQVAALATTDYLHRSSTHRGVSFHWSVEFLMQMILWLTTGINRREWGAVHLCHHAFADKEGDPHSPILLGLWPVQLGNVFLYRKATKDPKVLWYGRNIRLSWAERTIFKSPYVGLLTGIALVCYLFGFWQGLIISLTHALLYLFLLNNLINGWCHVRGYKNFRFTLAYNNRFIAAITMGEGLHNNHHFRPQRAKLSVKKNEFDIGWGFIKILSYLKLASYK
ncbi:MAG: fatty acid desaturase [Patescibacteria group bacterium]